MRTIVCLIAAIAALSALAATAGARSSLNCRQTNSTFMQASRDGALPGIYAALHGGAPPTSLGCSRSKP